MRYASCWRYHRFLKSPKQAQKIMDIIVTMCVVFCLTVSDTKTEIVCS